MAINQKRGLTPEETAAIVSATAIAKGKDIAQSAIVGILGRGKPFARIHVGVTDVDLGKTPSERGGYTVVALFEGKSAHTTAAVAQAIGTWLSACHGERYESSPAKSVVKPGSKTLYLAVAYAAKA